MAKKSRKSKTNNEEVLRSELAKRPLWMYTRGGAMDTELPDLEKYRAEFLLSVAMRADLLHEVIDSQEMMKSDKLIIQLESINAPKFVPVAVKPAKTIGRIENEVYVGNIIKKNPFISVLDSISEFIRVKSLTRRNKGGDKMVIE